MRIFTLFALCALLCCSEGHSEGHKQEDCLKKELQVTMIRRIMTMYKDIERSLPRDNNTFHRILRNPKKCRLNVPDFKRVLEIYYEHVFEKVLQDNTLQFPKKDDFMDAFKRLKDIMQFCAAEGKPTQSSCGREKLKKFEKMLNKLQPEDNIKALSELPTVLFWISSAIDRSNMSMKIH